MNERERLVEELEKIEVVYDHGEDGMSKPQNLLVDEIEVIADFIIADRKRIVEPIYTYKAEHGVAWGNTFVCEAIDETLKLALGE